MSECVIVRCVLRSRAFFSPTANHCGTILSVFLIVPLPHVGTTAASRTIHAQLTEHDVGKQQQVHASALAAAAAAAAAPASDAAVEAAAEAVRLKRKLKGCLICHPALNALTAMRSTKAPASSGRGRGRRGGRGGRGGGGGGLD
jgi:hypothetical protein